jgi:hypothetical protein
MEQEIISNEAAVTAEVVNNVEGAAVPTTSEEPKAEAAKTLLQIALKGSRSEQCELFGRHFSSTQKVDVIQRGAETFLSSVENWQQNLNDLLAEIKQQEAESFLTKVTDNAEKLSDEEIQKVIERLQATRANKTA